MLTGWRNFDDAFRTIDFLHRHFAFDDALRERWVIGPARELPRRRVAWPAVNISETKEAYVVRAEVPGLAEGEVTVQIEDDALLVSGERKTPAPEGYQVHVRERAPFALGRKLPLPGRVDAGAVTATMKDGILVVTLPKSGDALPRQIAVKAG
ncbi:MAG TPA: Hsp20/alpha crystallin family protein [Polyangiaceae bacterium]|jgi:HSP20 family protein|nr:Hsp20/alpha crystallin family protein [Polyangiaceae bacterium]